LLRMAGVHLNTGPTPAMPAPPACQPECAARVLALTNLVHTIFQKLLVDTDAVVSRGAAECHVKHLLRQTQGYSHSLPDLLAKHPLPERCCVRPCTVAAATMDVGMERTFPGNAVAVDPPSLGSSSTDLDVDDDASVRSQMEGLSEAESESTGGHVGDAEAVWHLCPGGRVTQSQVALCVRGLGGAVVPLVASNRESLHLWRVKFASQCEHHMLPFYGTVCVVVRAPPDEPPVSAAVVQDIVDLYCCRLQVQERITHNVAHALHQACECLPVLVVCDSAHMCMVARGVEKHASSTMTCAVRGAPEADEVLRTSMLESLLVALDAAGATQR
jgi:hypothetical protein